MISKVRFGAHFHMDPKRMLSNTSKRSTFKVPPGMSPDDVFAALAPSVVERISKSKAVIEQIPKFKLSLKILSELPPPESTFEMTLPRLVELSPNCPELRMLALKGLGIDLPYPCQLADSTEFDQRYGGADTARRVVYAYHKSVSPLYRPSGRNRPLWSKIYPECSWRLARFLERYKYH